MQAEITETQFNKPAAARQPAPIAGIRDGNRLPTSPELQAAATVAFNWGLGNSLESYVRFTAQHVGSSFTQLADQEPNFGLISAGAAAGCGASSSTSAP